MTFYEAAVEVLRRSGRPLHYKKITEIAVREDLLSHVGKTPEVTMNDRLEKEIRKDDEVHIERTRPGVFKLDEEYAKKLNEEAKERDRKRREQRRKQRQQQQRQTEDESAGQSRSQSQEADRGDDSGRRSARGSNQTDHRRRRSRDEEPDSDDRDRQQGSDQQTDGRDQRERGGRDRHQQRRERRSDGSSDGSLGDLTTETHLSEGPVQLDGIARAAHKVLDEQDGDSMHIDELADEIFGRKLVKFHTHDPEATVRSALFNDNQIRKKQGHRPLFAEDGDGYWRLTEWSLDAPVVEREQALLSLSEQIRQKTIDQFADQLLEVKDESLEHLALTLLERLGYHNIKVSKRSSNGDVFFTADWRQGLADVRVCIQVVTDGQRQIGSDTVEELRDTLEHYSASEGVLIHLGSISGDAIDAGRRSNAEAITLLDRTTFVELLVKHGIGVKTYEVPVVTVDDEFIHALNG